jgi:hypothetical protein
LVIDVGSLAVAEAARRPTAQVGVDAAL